MSVTDQEKMNTGIEKKRAHVSTTMKTLKTGSFAVEANEISKIHGGGEGAVHTLRDVSVGFETKRFTAIMGAPGSGKSLRM